jgi:heme exporter protein A
MTMTDEQPVVLARGLRARFGRVLALRDLSFEVQAGQRLAIFGPNGAGKTTLLRLLAGLLRPTAGEIRLFGHDALRESAALRARLGVLGHTTYLYPELTARENLRLFGQLYDVPDLEQRVDQRLALVGLAARRDDRIETLSRGLQQRLAIARAMLHDPDLLLLDEPDTGLDLPAFDLLAELLVGGAARPTILMATHNLVQARRICQQALVLVGGRLVQQRVLTDLTANRLQDLYREPLLAS